MKNLIAFHGADHKVGTTMIAQSAAEVIAGAHKDIKILFVSLQGRPGTEYIREVGQTIDGLKVYLNNRVLPREELLRTCRKTENYYFLGGVEDPMEGRRYFPDAAIYLLDTVADEFDLILADTGNNPDNGLTAGALQTAGIRYSVLTQQETALRRYEQMRRIYDMMEIRFDHWVINKFIPDDPYSLPLIAKRLHIPSEKLLPVDFAGYGREAEMDCRTLLSYRNEKYLSDITDLANRILEQTGFPLIEKPRKNKWNPFI
ncbi:MAG: hypothetical protein IJO79_03590 [Firmicutes bacterium]|nr:hypothetical protein [Bacillota bacterium]